MKKTIKIHSSVDVYNSYSYFDKQENELFEAAPKACQNAYAPYSNFKVGAAVLLENGTICMGNNQENAAYPSGLCAERVALFHAAAVNPNVPVKAIAITVDYANLNGFNDIISPCGSCRQSIAEYEHKFRNDIKLYLLGRKQKVCVIPSVQSILPFLFTGDILQSMEKKTPVRLNGKAR